MSSADGALHCGILVIGAGCSRWRRRQLQRQKQQAAECKRPITDSEALCWLSIRTAAGWAHGDRIFDTLAHQPPSLTPLPGTADHPTHTR